MTPVFDCGPGDKVRVRRGWNPFADTRTVLRVDESTGEVHLDCTADNGVRITAANAHMWEKILEDRG
jgi:hypothetical protein